MNKKKIFLKTENYANLNKDNLIKKHKFSLSMRNYNLKLSKANSQLKHPKIKLKQQLLINLLKNSNIKRRTGGNQTHSIISYHSFNNIKDNILNTDFKNYYNLNKNFHNLPGLSKFHNLTNEKMNNLIKSDVNYKSAKSFNNNINNKHNLKIKSCENNNKEKIFNNRYITDKSIIIYKNKDEFFEHSKGSKKVKLKMNKFKKNFTNSLLYLRNEKPLLNSNNSLSYLKNEKEIVEKITSNVKKMKLNRSFNPNKYSTQIWMASVKDLNKNNDILNMGTKKDKLIFYIEKPEESYDLKPIDKYQLLKNQIAKHKNKLENIIKEMKLNQIKNEYLMKKFIFDLMSRKKKIY